jgi:serine/threonine protein kinase
MLADFGISRIAMIVNAPVERVLGTTNWMAPELFSDRSTLPTQKSDIWTFGCTCYEVRPS